MALLLDTHILVWIGANDRRLSISARAAIEDIDNVIFISAIVAFEFHELHQRGRFGVVAGLEEIMRRIEAQILPLPAEIWRVIDAVPDLHRDPVDRMLVAHAIHADLTLVTGDETMRHYPVKTLW